MDIRLPAGWMFVVMGSLLAIYGAARGIRLDLVWGVVLVVISGGVLAVAYRASGRRGER